MHRMKIGLLSAGLLAVVAVVFFLNVSSDTRQSVIKDVEEQVSRAQRVFQQISRLGGIDFASVAAERARRSTVAAVFDRPDETARRQAAYEECEAINAALQKDGRRADIMAILDSSGKVLARDLNPNAMFGEDLKGKFLAVGQALKGRPVKDIWTLQNRMTEVALAPITKGDGTIVGAVLVGYVVSAIKAQANRDLLGTEIGYFHNGKVHTSSFAAAGENGKEDVNRTVALNSILFQGPGKLAETALQGAPTEISHHQLEGRDYAVVAAPLPGNFGDKTSGVVMLASVTDRLGTVRGPGRAVLIFGIIGILVALAAAVMTAKRFIRPLDQ